MQVPPNEHNNFSLVRFESMLKTNSVLFFDSEEFEDIVHHYLETGKFALAKKATKLGLEQHPTSTNLKLFEIEMFIIENKLDIADTLLEKLYELEKSNEEILIQKANILSRRAKHNEAIEVLQKALLISNDEYDILGLLGMEFMFLEDYENAKTYFLKCLEEDDQDFSALYNVIFCFEFLDQKNEAIEYMTDYLDKNPYCDMAWFHLGKAYYSLGKYKKAIAAFDFAIISDDTFVGAYLEKGKVLEKLGRFELAIESYSVTLALEDPTSFALLRIGKCHEKMKNMDLALQFYLRCVEEDTLLDKAWIAITDFYFRNKNYKKALYYINRAINIDTQNVLYWKRYGKINNHLNNFEEAEVGYRKALELGNHELESWLTRGDILIKLGENQAAINNFNQALEFYPQMAEVEYRLAGLFYKENVPHKGAFHLTNALKNDSEFIIIMEELFPEVLLISSVKDILKLNNDTPPKK